jgi:hypothetical protein
MNLRKTITGAAVALGGASVMLGLGTTSALAGPIAGDVESNPSLPLQAGEAAEAGGLASVDTTNPAGKIQALNGRDMNVADVAAENLDADVIAHVLGYDSTPGQPGHVGVHTQP